MLMGNKGRYLEEYSALQIDVSNRLASVNDKFGSLEIPDDLREYVWYFEDR